MLCRHLVYITKTRKADIFPIMVSTQTAVRLFFIIILMILILMYYFYREIVAWNDSLVKTNEIHLLDEPGEGYDAEPKAVLFEEDGVLNVPILLWWTPFTGEEGQTKKCGNSSCFLTVNRKYRDHPNTKVFLFYGTDFKYGDLPVPRLRHQEWALFHEESPQNNYLFSHDNVLELFNHTSTFRRESDLPLTLQYLRSTEDLESFEYVVNLKEKNNLLKDGTVALVNYVQSDCGAPSDRDHFVQMLKRHIDVDALGKCEHNKDLPEHLQDPIQGMDHKDFYRHIARYKFTITFENAVCDDYVTEKFWRPFRVGSVPIVFGSPKVRDLLPSPKSAILVSDFTKIEDLVSYIKYLDSNDEAYNQYLSFKRHGVSNPLLKSLLTSREWGINADPDRPNMIDAFECMVCKRVSENWERNKKSLEPVSHQASKHHYGCPKPLTFSDKPKGSLSRVDGKWWGAEWTYTSYIAKALTIFLAREMNFTGKQVEILASSLEMKHYKDY